ncbi:hypothetical protein [Mycobacterium decipiens]|nr:hypothetical protein [Mycobacterium decipiens]
MTGLADPTISWAADDRGPKRLLKYPRCHLISRTSATFEQAFLVEHDAVFDDFLRGSVGLRSTP